MFLRIKIGNTKKFIHTSQFYLAGSHPNKQTDAMRKSGEIVDCGGRQLISIFEYSL